MSSLASTHRRLAELGIARATLLVDPARVRANIARFAARARDSGVRLRPHFKTHQSADIAGWFADAGVTAATVSSLSMARYFADHGWTDLTLAIGVNPREVGTLRELTDRIDLGLLVDHPRQVHALVEAGITAGVWVEIDTGAGRAGVPLSDTERCARLVQAITAGRSLDYRGLLAHAGHAYDRRPADAAAIFVQTRDDLRALNAELVARGLPRGEISAGDTPGFAANPAWQGLDEARPGNFVFHDLMQLIVGACTERDLACAVACPVIGTYPERQQVVVHAGAVHLSKEVLATGQGPIYGRLLNFDAGGFGALNSEGVLTSLSQEHGVITFASESAARSLGPGDLVLVVPVHSCLTCEQFAEYLTVDGHRLARHVRTTS